MTAIRTLARLEPDHVAQLAELLIAAVTEGASVGFLPPLAREEAERYWQTVFEPGVVLLVAEQDGRIVGTVQLALALRANGRYRAEVNKLLVHPAHRRQGIARRLMAEVETVARREGRTLLHLDTREGDPSHDLYRALGWVEAGRIPRWAGSASGRLEATVFYYRLLA
jgi:GNAT superfamily N-acetyltransferase